MASELEIGAHLDHYIIEEKIGQGGMGVIYKARDTKLERTVALKVLTGERTRDEKAKNRFLKEARVASAIDHPNICTIHEIGETPEGQMYIVMAYYPGRSLKDTISPAESADDAEHPRLDIKEVTELAIQIAAGLGRAHQAGIVHRDVKPSNIMITEFGEVKIVDFGLAKLTTSDQLTRSDRITGTVAFMSPEQVRGKPIDFRSDIWSFGVVLYEMVTGRLPFDEEYPQATMYSIVTKDPKPVQEDNDAVPLGMATIIANCLRKDRDERYATTEALLSDLRQLQLALDSGTADSLAETIELPRSSSRRRYHSPRNAAIAACAVVCLLAAFWLFFPANRPKTGPTPFVEHHLVVLPLTLLGGDEAQQALCDGLMETLVSQIAQLQADNTSFWVVPTSEVRRQDVTSCSQAQKAFGVNLVIEGSLQPVASGLNLTLNLVDANALRVVASRSVSAAAGNLPSFQARILDVLAEMLHVTAESRPDVGSLPSTSLVPGATEFYLQGMGYLQQSYTDPTKLDIAIELFQRALSEDASFAQAYNGIAKALRRKFLLEKDAKWLHEAQTHCARAMELDDGSPCILVTAATIQDQLGHHEEALALSNRALAQDPNDFQALRRQAKALEALGEIEPAEEAYQRAIALKPDFWLSHDALGQFYYRQARYDEAADQMVQVLRLTPDNAVAYRNLGGIYFYQDRRKEARDMFEKSLDLAPNYGTYANLGTLYYFEGRYVDAAEAYRQALAISDRDYRVWAYLADALVWVPGKKDQAEAAYQHGIALAETALAVNPDNATLLADLAEMHVSLGENEASRSLLNRLEGRQNLDLDVLFRIARIHERLGERETALAVFEHLLDAGYALPGFEQNPWMEGIRADPRFQRLQAKHQGQATER